MNDQENKFSIQRRRNKVRCLLVAGYTIEEIKQRCDFSDKEIDEFFVLIQNKSKLTTANYRISSIYFGGKKEAYFSPEMFSEQDLVDHKFDYDYQDLSESEKEIYNSLTKKSTKQLWGLTIKSLFKIN